MHSEQSQELNLLTKEAIFTALMQLMEKKDYNDISITEIAERAGVSRMAYYRNYNSKEDIIIKEMDRIFKEYVDDVLHKYHEDFGSLYVEFFRHFRNYHSMVEMLIKADLTYLILDQFDSYINFVEKTFFSKFLPNGVDKYELYYAAGGIYKVLIEWIKGGMKESDEEMAEILQKLGYYLDIDINKVNMGYKFAKRLQK